MNCDTVGEVAGKIWKALGARGRVTLATLPKLVDEDAIVVQMAVGWLAREDKVEFLQQGRAISVQLTAGEAEAYKQRAGCE